VCAQCVGRLLSCLLVSVGRGVWNGGLAACTQLLAPSPALCVCMSLGVSQGLQPFVMSLITAMGTQSAGAHAHGGAFDAAGRTAVSPPPRRLAPRPCGCGLMRAAISARIGRLRGLVPASAHRHSLWLPHCDAPHNPSPSLFWPRVPTAYRCICRTLSRSEAVFRGCTLGSTADASKPHTPRKQRPHQIQQ
jgi:hypothetical protein